MGSTSAAYPAGTPPAGTHPATSRAMMGALPVDARISHVRLMTGTSAAGSWHTMAELPLAG